MRGKHTSHARAATQHRWSGARKIVTAAGYVKVRVGTSHPLADPNGYAYEHVVVWCAAGNPRPIVGMVLHHRNGTRDDNRLENLELMRRSTHNKHHNRGRRDPKTGRLMPAAGAMLDGREHREFPA